MPTMWDKRAEDAAKSVAGAIKHEVEVVAEHNVQTPAKVEAAAADAATKIEQVVKTETAVVTEHNQGNVAKVEAEVKTEAHVVADAVDAHAATLFGGIAHSLKDFAARLRSGEEKLTDEVKAELAKIGVKL